MKKLLALLLALVMILGLAACTTTPDPTDPPASNPPATDAPTNPPTDAPTDAPTEPVVEEKFAQITHIEPDNDPYIVPKYTETTTADGWILVENQGGETLGYHPDSGVKIIQVEGFAFKDLDQDGKLDGYEDWRNTNEERAADLVAQMQGAEMAQMMSHGGYGSFTTEPMDDDHSTVTFLQAGGRGGVSRNIGQGGAAHATWANLIQSEAEACFYGIPAMISIDPANVCGVVETLSLASTMDTEIAAEIGNLTAQLYRAAGVTALLGPQVDIASPIMSRAGGTYGEDTRLTLDITTAYVNAMQSTYAEDGTDLGWGAESVFCFTKHFAGAGSTEGGRDDHSNGGRYAIFTGDNYEAHLITYFDGVFSLPGLTGSSGIMTEYAINVDAEGEPYGGEWAGAYNEYQYGMLDEFGFESLVITDWGVYTSQGVWGAEELTVPERIATSWERGANLLGGYSGVDNINDAYQVLVDNNGEEGALEIIQQAAYNYIIVMMNLEMFDQPYCDTAAADALFASAETLATALNSQRASVVMIKNDGTIKAAEGENTEKPTVYVPWSFTGAGKTYSWMSGWSESAGSWTCPMDTAALGEYFNVITDSVDADGNIVRASEADIASCDYILVGMQAAFTTSAESTDENGEVVWVPASLQYAEYTADTAREESVSGKVTVNTVYDPYGAIVSEEKVKENRSYKGNTAPKDVNYGYLETLQWVDSIAGEIPVIVSMQMERGMVWSEVEPLADVILVCYNSQRNQVVAEIILGQTEPNGLLVFQQPKDMLVVEAQDSDVPRDMECYVDANGNTYDFAFGLNWAGVINDERVATYSQAPLTDLVNFDYDAYEANNHK